MFPLAGVVSHSYRPELVQVTVPLGSWALSLVVTSPFISCSALCVNWFPKSNSSMHTSLPSKEEQLCPLQTCFCIFLLHSMSVPELLNFRWLRSRSDALKQLGVAFATLSKSPSNEIRDNTGEVTRSQHCFFRVSFFTELFLLPLLHLILSEEFLRVTVTVREGRQECESWGWGSGDGDRDRSFEVSEAQARPSLSLPAAC